MAVQPRKLKGDQPPLARSLRWRLPLYFAAPVVLLLAGFLWAMHRQLESATLETGRERARHAAEQVADLLARALGRELDRSADMASTPVLGAYLSTPNAETAAAALAALDSLDDSPDRTIELWSADGSLMLESEAPAATTEGRPEDAALAERFPPTRAGVSELRTVDDARVFDIVTEVRGDEASGAPLLGWLRRSGRVTVAEERALAGLVGGGARIDLESGRRAADSGAGDADAAGADAGDAAARDSEVSARALVPNSAWVVRVAFPRASLVGPAHAFLARMALLALLCVIAGIILFLYLGVRLTRPLHALAGAAEEIAAGDYSRRVDAGRRDEIGRLADAFNTMSDSIEDAHRRLQDTNDQTHFALAAAHIGVWKVELDTGRMACSESMRTVHGMPEMGLPCTTSAFLELVHEDDRAAVATLLSGDWGEDEVLDVEYRAVGADGSLHWVEGKGQVKRDADGSPASVIGASIDVTDRRRLESQFLQAQKMEAVGQLAGGVAHDFNNLLTSILGHGNLILSELPEGDPLREDVIEILRGGESGARLTRQLLSFSRKQVTQHEIIAIDTIVRNTKKLLGRLIGEHITLVTRLAPDLEAVRADQGQIEQVLVNLAVNARDAMPDGGTLTIETANVDLTHSYAREHVGVTPGRYVVLTVSDTGAGMDPETQKHVFEPFFTTKAPDKGTGLGLATVFGIVKQANGHIYLYSEPGRGTTFKVYLPAAGKRPLAAGAAAPSEVVGGSETILIVEDNASVRRVAKTILERIGYRVIEAGDGGEALALIERDRMVPDLVLSDVIMPGMTGPELWRRIAQRHDGIRVLFTSGYSGDALGQRGLEDPGVMFIEKPYSPVTLARKVRAALDEPAPEPAGAQDAVGGRSTRRG